MDRMVTHDEGSSQSRLNCEINELVQKHVEGQERVDTADPASNPEDAGTWYYVVDCAICKAVIPFKHAPEGEPILRFPTMGVRCFQCRTVHTYAADLVSYRKAVAPRESFKRDEPLYARDDAGETSPSEDRSLAVSAGQAISECEIASVGSLLRPDSSVIRAPREKGPAIFLLSSCFFSAGWVLQLAPGIFYRAQLGMLSESGSSGPTVLSGIGYLSAVFGLILFIFGIGRLFVEACGFKGDVDQFVLRTFCSRLVAGRIVVPWIVAARKKTERLKVIVFGARRVSALCQSFYRRQERA
jgi:hypothetical protein